MPPRETSPERPSARETIHQQAGHDTASKLETAARNGDHATHNKLMTEVGSYSDRLSKEDRKAYTETITKDLEKRGLLPTVSLMEAHRSWDKIDTSGNKRLEKGELEQFADRQSTSDLQRKFVGSLQQDYDKVRMHSKYGESWGFNSAAIADQDVNDGLSQQRALLNLYAPDKTGKSLHDRMTNKAGNIGDDWLDDELDKDKDTNGERLTDQDRHTLKTLDSFDNRTLKSYLPWSDDYKKDRLAKLSEESGLDPTKLENQKRDARVETSPLPSDATPHRKEMAAEFQREQIEEAKREPHKAARAVERDAELKKALTINKGEGYGAVAERLLKMNGHEDFSAREFQEVVRQLKKADGLKPYLRVNQVLTIDRNLRENENLKKLFE